MFTIWNCDGWASWPELQTLVCGLFNAGRSTRRMCGIMEAHWCLSQQLERRDIDKEKCLEFKKCKKIQQSLTSLCTPTSRAAQSLPEEGSVWMEEPPSVSTHHCDTRSQDLSLHHFIHTTYVMLEVSTGRSRLIFSELNISSYRVSLLRCDDE